MVITTENKVLISQLMCEQVIEDLRPFETSLYSLS